jgi:hypothetical protein
MLELLKAFVAIALRREGPEILPDSGFLLALTLAAYVALQMPVALLVFGANGDALRTILYDAGLLIVCLWALLWLMGYARRYRQTLTALLGTSALLSAVSIPFNLWRESPVTAVSGTGLPSAFILAIVLWSFVIDGHIVARALSRPFAIGLMVAIAYFFVHTTLLFEFVPVPD